VPAPDDQQNGNCDYPGHCNRPGTKQADGQAGRELGHKRMSPPPIPTTSGTRSSRSSKVCPCARWLWRPGSRFATARRFGEASESRIRATGQLYWQRLTGARVGRVAGYRNETTSFCDRANGRPWRVARSSSGDAKSLYGNALDGTLTIWPLISPPGLLAVRTTTEP
jgi:hypothetical protein